MGETLTLFTTSTGTFASQNGVFVFPILLSMIFFIMFSAWKRFADRIF